MQLTWLMLCVIYLVGNFQKVAESVSFGWKLAKIGQFPSTAGLLRIDNDDLIGGATIIHPQFVLATKISFEYYGYKVRVIAGDIDIFRNSTCPSRQERLATHYMHHLYPSRPMYDPVVVLRLDSPFKFTRFVKSLVINFGRPIIGTKLKIAGWSKPIYSEPCNEKGYTRFLKYIDVQVAATRVCPYEVHPEEGIFIHFLCFRGIQKDTFPASGMLDNGSPVYFGKRKIYGIVSPLLNKWNFVDGRRIETLKFYEEYISRMVAWDGKTRNPEAQAIYPPKT